MIVPLTWFYEVTKSAFLIHLAWISRVGRRVIWLSTRYYCIGMAWHTVKAITEFWNNSNDGNSTVVGYECMTFVGVNFEREETKMSWIRNRSNSSMTKSELVVVVKHNYFQKSYAELYLSIQLICRYIFDGQPQ